ncbi:MAG: hypothetical protein H0V82_10035 [Candidatus Protochlamydia sp.]|nr:hypothetical protein [Candidatus Protochlamydia sp.]
MGRAKQQLQCRKSEATNKRAIHVYQKVGFKIAGEFIASWHSMPHYQMELHIRDLLDVK